VPAPACYNPWAPPIFPAPRPEPLPLRGYRWWLTSPIFPTINDRACAADPCRLADSASASIGKAISNVPASAYAFGKGVAQPFIHPVDTLEGFKNLGLGVLEKAGIKGGAEHEKYADALGHYFADRYGSPENLKRTFEQDPVGLAGDLSTLFIAGVPLAGVRAAGVIERVGKAAGTVERAGAAGEIGSALKAEARAAADAAVVVAKELPVLYFDRAVRTS